MKKRLLALLLTAAMAVGCLVGCGEKQTESSQEKKEESSVKKEESSKATESSVEVKEDPVKVTWLFRIDPQDDQQMVEDAINEILRERYNLELDMQFVSSGEYADRIKLMTTSGEAFDICWTANWGNKFDGHMSRGAFLALDELLESDAGALLREAVPEEYWSAATVNGKIYAVPNNQIMYSHAGIAIQKELADKYGLDVTKVDELRDLEPFFQKILENEPNLYPYSTTGTTAFRDADNTKVQSFGSCVSIYKDDPEFKVVANVDLEISEDYLEASELYHEWWEKGYIRSDQLTVTNDTENVNANRYAAFTTTYKEGVEASLLDKHGIEYYCVPVGDPYRSVNAPQATMNAISATSLNPEAAIKMLGVMYTDVEVYNMVCFGLEGVHYNWVDDKHIAKVADSGYKGFSGWEIADQFNAYLLEGQADNTWELTKAGNEAAPANPFDGFVLDKTPIEAELANISSVTTEYKGRFYDENYEKLREEYKEKLYKAGLDKVVEEVQKQIDAWRAVNGK